MNKNERKLIKYFDQATECTSRKEAQKLILKADKVKAKLLLKQILKDLNN